MDLKSKFYTVFRTLNPYNHLELSENKLFDVLRYYVFIIVFSVILMSILFIPHIYSARDYVERGVEHFDNLTVSSEFNLKDSFNILSDPVIRFDKSDDNVSNDLVVITPDSLYYRKYLLFGPQRGIALNKNVDVVSSERAQKLISFGFFFLLPALLFWAVIFSLLYFSVIIILTYLLVLTLSGAMRINVSLLRLLKMCIYASTIFILLQLLLMPFYRSLILPLIVYWLLVIIILFLWQDNMYKVGRNISGGSGGGRDIFSTHGKHKEIFDGDGESKHHRTEKRDSYDVDEHGNMKGSGASKKHKSFEDDDDGYIELK